MKYDLSKIMKRAWEIKREDKNNVFGLCLSLAWEESKNPNKKVTIKEWFMNKKFGKETENFGNNMNVIKETEKAVYGSVYYIDGSPMEIWVPKSCLY